MEQLIFCIFIDYRGHHRKVIAIYNAAEINLQPKPCFHLTNYVFLNTTERFKQEKNILIDIIFVMKRFYWWPFLSCPQ